MTNLASGGGKTRRMKRWCVGMAALMVAAVLGALAWLSAGRVESTQGGAHRRLLLPIGSGAVGVQVYSGSGDAVMLRGHLDGPVVRRGRDGTWSATWFCQDRAYTARGRSDNLEIACAGRRQSFALDSAPVPAAVAPMPARLAVLSDLEGNLRFMDAALARLGIVDGDGRWQYGRGQLVVLGDSVDRGRDTFAVLWRLHELARQAHAAGGAVRVVLGNHEQYILRGNVSRAHPEHRYALREMGGYAHAFAADTVIGAWLRAQPVAVKLGRVLLVHGGVSPGVADAGLSVDDLNGAMRNYWRTVPGTATRSAALDAVMGSAGVTQYRGYLMALDEAQPMATQADVDRVAAHHGVDQIVVAHTLVDRVQFLHGGKVIAVDVNEAQARPEALTYVDGVARVVDIGVARDLDTQPLTRTREFSLWEPADRRLLGQMVGAYRDLSALPQPY